MPTLNPRAIHQTTLSLNAGRLVLIADAPDRSLARLAVAGILRSGAVNCLFLEVRSDSQATNGFAATAVGDQYGVYLDDAAQAMSRSKLKADAAEILLERGGYFTTRDLAHGGRVPVGGGARPDLKGLAALAIEAGARVVPCDASPAGAINAMAWARGPGEEQAPLDTLSSADGLGYRGLRAAARVRDFVESTGIRTGLLMLWDAGHVDGNADRKGLKELLAERGFLVESHMSPSAFFTSVP
jgi:hypothetical protein